MEGIHSPAPPPPSHPPTRNWKFRNSKSPPQPIVHAIINSQVYKKDFTSCFANFSRLSWGQRLFLLSKTITTSSNINNSNALWWKMEADIFGKGCLEHRDGKHVGNSVNFRHSRHYKIKFPFNFPIVIFENLRGKKSFSENLRSDESPWGKRENKMFGRTNRKTSNSW